MSLDSKEKKVTDSQEIKPKLGILPLSITKQVKLAQVTEGRASLKNLGGRLEKSWLKPPSCREIQPFCCLLKSVFIRYNGISMHSVNQSLRKDLTEVKRVSEGFLRTAAWETDSRSSWMVLPSDYKMREAYKAKPIKFHKLSVKKYNWTWQVRVPIKYGSTGVQNGCRVESGDLETECNWQVLLWIGLILSLGLMQVKETSSSKWCRDSSLAKFSMASWLPFLYTWSVIPVVVQLLSRVRLFVTPWTAACLTPWTAAP